MYCPYCRKQTPDDSLFCQECGIRIEADSRVSVKPVITAEENETVQAGGTESPENQERSSATKITLPDKETLKKHKKI